MRTWSTPVVEELDIKLTASSGLPGTTEAAGYMSGEAWIDPTFDSAVYEDNGDCVIPKKDTAES